MGAFTTPAWKFKAVRIVAVKDDVGVQTVVLPLVGSSFHLYDTFTDSNQHPLHTDWVLVFLCTA